MACSRAASESVGWRLRTCARRSSTTEAASCLCTVRYPSSSSLRSVRRNTATSQIESAHASTPRRMASAQSVMSCLSPKRWLRCVMRCCAIVSIGTAAARQRLSDLAFVAYTASIVSSSCRRLSLRRPLKSSRGPIAGGDVPAAAAAAAAAALPAAAAATALPAAAAGAAAAAAAATAELSRLEADGKRAATDSGDATAAPAPAANALAAAGGVFGKAVAITRRAPCATASVRASPSSESSDITC
mmetsp:Transcript_799/g.2921  ORF Transcript_799/g.2921 Transcript_799/m.2921 type:complete len:245 (+) Transcript_799:877-1611(+)